jgi:hypothetical protein
MKPDFLAGGEPDMPAAAPAAAPEMKSNEICVPTSALAMPDEGEQLTNPEEGDIVTLQVEGKVSRVEGDKAYVTPSSVNGQDVGAEEDEPRSPEEQDMTDYGELEGMARNQGTM